MNPHEHLRRFYETCQFCVPPATVTKDQKKLRLFAFTLTKRAKDWLLSIPRGTIQHIGRRKLRFPLLSRVRMNLCKMHGRELNCYSKDAQPMT